MWGSVYISIFYWHEYFDWSKKNILKKTSNNRVGILTRKLSTWPWIIYCWNQYLKVFLEINVEIRVNFTHSVTILIILAILNFKFWRYRLTLYGRPLYLPRSCINTSRHNKKVLIFDRFNEAWWKCVISY
jgi:hypothetical protein